MFVNRKFPVERDTAAVGNVKLLTLDKHFEVVKGAAGLSLFELDEPVLKRLL